MTTQEAIDAIRNAASLSEASRIRNEVADEAYKRLRPADDSTVVGNVFWQCWSNAVLQSHREIPRQAPLHFTGD